MTVIWRLSGEEIGSCNCAWGCPCQFDALPTHGRCEGMGVCQVTKGHYGGVVLDGIRFAYLMSFPGAVHEGNGTLQVVIDDTAKGDQREALEQITSGRAGGLMFEIFASVCPTRLPILFAPIQFEADREARRGTYRVGALAEGTIEPIRNPVTGEEHRARIDLPHGFEYKTAEMGNSVDWRMSGRPPLLVHHQNTYAQLNQFDWSNL
jgi:hypothetical protein